MSQKAEEMESNSAKNVRDLILKNQKLFGEDPDLEKIHQEKVMPSEAGKENNSANVENEEELDSSIENITVAESVNDAANDAREENRKEQVAELPIDEANDSNVTLRQTAAKKRLIKSQKSTAEKENNSPNIVQNEEGSDSSYASSLPITVQDTSNNSSDSSSEESSDDEGVIEKATKPDDRGSKSPIVDARREIKEEVAELPIDEAKQVAKKPRMQEEVAEEDQATLPINEKVVPTQAAAKKPRKQAGKPIAKKTRKQPRKKEVTKEDEATLPINEEVVPAQAAAKKPRKKAVAKEDEATLPISEEVVPARAAAKKPRKKAVAKEDQVTLPINEANVPTFTSRPPISVEKKRIGQSKKAGLIFPVARIRNNLKKGRYAPKIQRGAAVYLAAVLEYLVAEVGEVARNAAVANKKKRITPRYLNLAIQQDDELKELFKNVTIAQGGVVPHIESVLFPKQAKAKKSVV